MDEHDDDLESHVHEQAEEETDSYPDTDDEIGSLNEETEDDLDDLDLDEDESEL
jgi:hypothetical protein